MDSRTKLEKWLWDVIGPPLYYCETCKKQVDVKVKGEDVTLKRFCEHNDAQVIAPRTALVSGKGFAGLSMGSKVKSLAQQGAAALTGRCV